MPSDISSIIAQINSNTNQVQFQQGQKNMGTSTLDKNTFLSLLLTQLRYQDPLNPVDDKEFISQQAQFTQIEKMDELNKNLVQGNTISQASSLVGKTVEVKDGNNVFTGVVDTALIGTDGIGLKIGNGTYTPSQITKIYPN